MISYIFAIVCTLLIGVMIWARFFKDRPRYRRPIDTTDTSEPPTEDAPNVPPAGSTDRRDVREVTNWTVPVTVGLVIIALAVFWLMSSDEDHSTSQEVARSGDLEAAWFEAGDHPVNDVPLAPLRTPRERVPDGYKVLPTAHAFYDPTALLIFCSETETGPERRGTWSQPCVGGFVSFSQTLDLGIPFNTDYKLHWVDS